MARILITGSLGMLGRRVVEALGPDHDVTASARTAREGRHALDVTDASAVDAAMAGVRPEWVVNCAAYTAVDRAEEESEAAFRVNAEGTGHLARACESAGARFLHVSTDFVFDGTKATPYVETDPTGGLGVYGRSKEAGEREARRCSRHVILRIGWLFGPDGGNFVRTMLRLGAERSEIQVVADQVGTPTYTVDAAETIRRVVEADLRGVIHATNAGETSWAGLAREALEAAGSAARVVPITTEEYAAGVAARGGTLAPRPANSRLENAVLAASIGDRLRPWEAAVHDFVGKGGAS